MYRVVGLVENMDFIIKVEDQTGLGGPLVEIQLDALP